MSAASTALENALLITLNSKNETPESRTIIFERDISEHDRTESCRTDIYYDTASAFDWSAVCKSVSLLHISPVNIL